MEGDPTATLLLRTIPDAERRLALCNDGTPAGFYYAAPASQPAQEPPVWLLFQQGGWWCWNNASCSERKRTENPSLTSSSGWETQLDLGGIFAEGRIATSAHRIYLRYCTSDAYLGNRTGPLGWHFRGRSVLAATIEEMLALGMGSTPGTRLLYGGCSAGGRGASYNIDWLRDSLLPASVTVRGFLDSPLWVDLPVLAPGQTSLREQCEAQADLHADALDSACLASHASEAWRCLLGESYLPFVEVPSVVFAYQDDTFQLWNAMGHSARPAIAAEEGFASRLREQSLAALRALPRRHAVFSAACWDHCVYGWRGYNQLRVGGDTPQTVAEKLLFEDATVWAIDECSGFDCCRGYPLAAARGGVPLWALLTSGGAVLAVLAVAAALLALRRSRRRTATEVVS